MANQDAKILFDSDRRVAVRHDVNHSAQALVPNKPEALSCVILDISSTGARIEVANEATFIPNKLKIYIADRHILADCEQKWRKGREIGLEFGSVIDFD